MGAECPNGHGRQPIIQNVTADFGIPKSSKEVVAHKLGCGCLIGGEELKTYTEAVAKIKAEENASIESVRKISQTKMRAALKVITDSGGVDNAE